MSVEVRGRLCRLRLFWSGLKGLVGEPRGEELVVGRSGAEGKRACG